MTNGNYTKKEDGRPSQQWYWDDWFSEFGLRLCSLAARGLWADMLGIMFKAETRGTLTVNGKQIHSKALAKLANDSKRNIEKYLKELAENDVFSRLEDGTIISRRMYRESKKKERIKEIRSEAGKQGAKQRWQEEDSKEIANDMTNDKAKDMAKMAASTSTPTSTSTSKECSENLPNPPKKEKSNKYKFLKKHLDEAKYLEGAIKETNPKHTIRGKQYLEDWANTFRIMEEKKEASLEEIRIMIDFAMGDPFWHSNILSAGKLREQFGRLWEQAKEKGKIKSDLNTGQRTTKQTPEEKEYWKAREAKEKELKEKGLDAGAIQSKIAVWSNNYWGAR